MKKKIVYIEWEDAASPAEDTCWWSEEGIRKWAREFDSFVFNVGFILEETKKYILLASEFNACLNNYAHPIRIPKIWIRKRVDLTKHIK